MSGVGGPQNRLSSPEDAQAGWTENQRWAIHAVKEGTPYVDRDALAWGLSGLQWPVAYFDFEFDPGMAVPRFPGFRPYEWVPFQWSLVVQPAPGAPLEQPLAFLHLEDTDPSRRFAESLLEAVPEKGSLVAHHATAEGTVLRQLARRLGGELGTALDSLRSRLADTETIAKTGYYHRDQQGSWSIKKLAPALIGRGYDDLEITHGMAAVMAWRQAVAAEGEERKRLRGELLRYCARDAELMHEILEALRGLVGV